MMRWLTELAKWGGVGLVALSGLFLYLIVLFVPDQGRAAVMPYGVLMAMGLVLAMFGYYLAPKYQAAARSWRPQETPEPPARTLSSLMTVAMAASRSSAPETGSEAPEPSSNSAPEPGAKPTFTVELDLATAKADRYTVDPVPQTTQKA